MGEIQFGQPRDGEGLNDAQRAELDRLREKQKKDGVPAPRKYEPRRIRDERNDEDPEEPPSERVIIPILTGGGVGSIGSGGRCGMPKREKPPRPAQGEDVIEPIKPVVPTGERKPDSREPDETSEGDGGNADKDVTYDRAGKIRRKPRTGSVIHEK